MDFPSFSFVFLCCCCGLATECFVINLLWCTVLSLTIGYFVGFCVNVSNDKSFDSIKSSFQILFVNMLQIWNLRYSINIWITKYVDLE